MRIGLLISFFGLTLAGCDPNRVYDDNKTMPEQKWVYTQRLPFDVHITDTVKRYNVYANLRVSGDYKYSNIFLWLHTTNPENKTDKRRVEIRLANQAGKLTGSGLGDLYEYRFPVMQQVIFNQAGFYRFELEQNMRDDTLYHINSVGIRVEEVQ